MVTLNAGIMYLPFTCMQFWVWEILRKMEYPLMRRLPVKWFTIAESLRNTALGGWAISPLVAAVQRHNLSPLIWTTRTRTTDKKVILEKSRFNWILAVTQMRSDYETHLVQTVVVQTVLLCSCEKRYAKAFKWSRQREQRNIKQTGYIMDADVGYTSGPVNGGPVTHLQGTR